MQQGAPGLSLGWETLVFERRSSNKLQQQPFLDLSYSFNVLAFPVSESTGYFSSAQVVLPKSQPQPGARSPDGIDL